jgi:hypothetical protein
MNYNVLWDVAQYRLPNRYRLFERQQFLGNIGDYLPADRAWILRRVDLLSKECLLFSTRVEFRRLGFDAIPGEFLTWLLLCLWVLYLGAFWLEYFCGCDFIPVDVWFEYCCGFDFMPGDFCLEYCSDFDVTTRDFLSWMLMWLWFDGWGLEVLGITVSFLRPYVTVRI